jgi:eukaryotic-like serine/threonine-protein kinase
MSAPLSASANAGLVPGAIIAGRYRLDGLLGIGGMGVVLSATHLDLNAPVAIKIVRDDLVMNEEVVARLAMEARAAARMSGTHMVRVLDVGWLETGAPYIVMERLLGSDLRAVLAEGGAIPVGEAVAYLVEACEGLAEAHGLGIIHRDLKPENLFLAKTPDGVVLKILDFGISKDVSEALKADGRPSLTRAGAVAGSPSYMSPEQMRASPQLDARADIWSLGAILFELLTGRCPFEAESIEQLFAKALTEEVPSLAAFPIEAPLMLDAIIGRCLTKDPRARYQTVTELAEALRDFAGGYGLAFASSASALARMPRKIDSTAPPRHTLTEDELPPFRRTRSRTALFGLGGLALVAVGFWLIQSSSGWFANPTTLAAELPSHASQRPTASAEPDPTRAIAASPAAPEGSYVLAPALAPLTQGCATRAPAAAAAVAPLAAVAPAGSSLTPAPVRASWPPPKRAAPADAVDAEGIAADYGL